MIKIWVICPCFFDTESFGRVKSETTAAILKKVPSCEIRFLLIDDSAGIDPAVKGIHGYSDLDVITVPYNMGHQAALVYALRSIGGSVADTDYVITMDADGEDRPEDTSLLLEQLLQNKENLSQISMAWRTHRRESFGFRIAYFFFKSVFRLLTGKIIKNGNFAAFRGWFLKETIYHPHFDQCYASSFISLPLQINFVPLPRGMRFFGKSKMSYSSLLTHGLKMLMPFTEKIATRGLVASCILALISVILFIVTLRISPLLALLSFFCAISFTFVAGLFVLLFATFSQSKATSLRHLHEWNQKAK